MTVAIAIPSRLNILLGALRRFTSARLRQLGIGAIHEDWQARAAICERCPIRVVRCGISYCGQPLLQQIEREPAEGCGCPCRDKAKDPGEHCPVDPHHQAAENYGGLCTCKWCVAKAKRI